MLYRFYLLLILFFSLPSYSAISTIVVTEGRACKIASEENSAVRIKAYINAKKQAVKTVQSNLSSNNKMLDFELRNYVVSAFSNAEVNTITVLGENWDKQKKCVNVSIQSEVMPFFETANNENMLKQFINNPSAPLTVNIWTDKTTLSSGEKMTVYLKGNKPFYGLLTYKDANNNILQILPNPNRKSNYFEGGMTHKVPNEDDKFELIIEPPFGVDRLSLYASTTPLGNVNKVAIGPAYQLKDSDKEIAIKTRGLAVKLTDAAKISNHIDDGNIHEFNQVSLDITTTQ